MRRGFLNGAVSAAGDFPGHILDAHRDSVFGNQDFFDAIDAERPLCLRDNLDRFLVWRVAIYSGAFADILDDCKIADWKYLD